MIVEGVFVYSIVRFAGGAASGGGVGAEAAAEPPQVYGSKPIEIAWTAAPLLIVMMIVLVSARTLWDVNVDPPKPQPGDNSLFVTVVGRQWWWEYRYDQYDGRTARLHHGQRIAHSGERRRQRRGLSILSLKSADVYHSFWVPRLAGKMALIPGRTNSMWFQTHRNRVVRRSVRRILRHATCQHADCAWSSTRRKDFQRWLDNEAKQAVDDPDPAAHKGKTAFLSQSCVNCHRSRGTDGQGQLCSRPDPFDEPPDARLGHDPQRRRGKEPSRLDRRPAEDQARLPDAVVWLEQDPARFDRGLPADAALTSSLGNWAISCAAPHCKNRFERVPPERVDNGRRRTRTRTSRAGWPAWTGVLHEWVTTVDHKKIGIMYVLMAVVFLVIAGCEAILMRWQLFSAQNTVRGPDFFNQLFTLHGTTMVFFMGMPILIGIGNYIVPLMIGARDMAFPRLNAMGFWATLFGGLLVYFSFVTGGAPAIGWFASLR